MTESLKKKNNGKKVVNYKMKMKVDMYCLFFTFFLFVIFNTVWFLTVVIDALIRFNCIKDTLIRWRKHKNQNQIYFKAIAEEINDWNTSSNHANCGQIRGCHFILLQKGIWKSENVKKSIKGWIKHTNLIGATQMMKNLTKK